MASQEFKEPEYKYELTVTHTSHPTDKRGKSKKSKLVNAAAQVVDGINKLAKAHGFKDNLTEIITPNPQTVLLTTSKAIDHIIKKADTMKKLGVSQVNI